MFGGNSSGLVSGGCSFGVLEIDAEYDGFSIVSILTISG
jgi:hypothetical protein